MPTHQYKLGLRKWKEGGYRDGIGAIQEGVQPAVIGWISSHAQCHPCKGDMIGLNALR